MTESSVTHERRLPMRLHFLLFAFFLIPGLAHSQAVAVWNAPEEAPATTTLRLPNGTSAHAFLRGHFILTADELSGVPAGELLRSFGMNYTDGTNTPANGLFRVYLQNTTDTTNQKSTNWATAVSTMTPAFNGTLNLPVGSTSSSVDLLLNGSNFTYSGFSLYVAYEYTGTTFATQAAVNKSSNSLPSSLFMAESTTSLPTTVTTATNFRPQVRLGFQNPYQDNLSIDALSVLFGDLNALWQDEINVTVANRGSNNQGNISLLLQVTGANADSHSLTIAHLAGGDSTTLTETKDEFVQGTQTIKATVTGAPDENPSDNQQTIPQQVSCTDLSYAGSLPAYDGIGFGISSGILALRYDAAPVPVSIVAVYAEIHDAPTNVGAKLSGTLLNASGNIIASSDPLTIDASHLGARVLFPLTTPVQFGTGSSMYAGVLQAAGSGAYPISTAGPAETAPDIVYSFPIGGGTPTNYTDLGTLKIGLVAMPTVTLQVGTNGSATHNQPVDIKATPGYGNYEFLVNNNPVQSGPSNVLTYIAHNLDTVSVTASRNACDAQIAVDVPVVVPDPIFANGFESP